MMNENCAPANRRLRKAALIGFSASALLFLNPYAQATNLVLNGNFSSYTTTGINTNGQVDYNVTLADWSMKPGGPTSGGGTLGYTELFTPGSADTTGVPVSFGHQLTLWGPGGGLSSHDYSNNGMPASSPIGGNYIGADAAFDVDAIQQTISGLTVGDHYALSFYYAGAQQGYDPSDPSGYSGATTETWQVSLGANTQTAPVLANASHGFTGWHYDTMNFTATNTSETLSFLAEGTPGVSQPPFALLDDVSLTKTPEPATLPLLLTGLMGGLSILRSRRKSLKS